MIRSVSIGCIMDANSKVKYSQPPQKKDRASQNPMPLNLILQLQKRGLKNQSSFSFGRDEATRTPDPYVPNVVRYQLRYIPIS